MRSFFGISVLSWILAVSFAGDVWPCAPQAAAAPSGEIRGLWVVRRSLESPEKIRAVISAASENGFNALFVQVRGRGEAYYESVIDPPARCLVAGRSEEPGAGEGSGSGAAGPPRTRVTTGAGSSGVDSVASPPAAWASPAAVAAANRARALPDRISFDPLRLLVDLAHEAGLAVHAWVNVYFTWSEEEPHPSPQHVLNSHPEWITADREGVRLDKLTRDELKAQWIEGIYLSPAIPEVRRYLTDVVLEIALNYPVDGIHLDYVRYPGRGTGADEYSRAEFARLHVFDPLTFLSEPDRARPPGETYWVDNIRALWIKWRAEQVTALVEDISEKLRAVSPGVVLSAAVKSDPALAADAYGQDWLRWLEEGYIDMAAPMIYTKSTAKFFGSVEDLRRAVPDSLEGRILAGMSLYNQSPRHAVEKIEVARAAGLGGFILFSYDSVADRKGKQYLPALRAGIMGGEGD